MLSVSVFMTPPSLPRRSAVRPAFLFFWFLALSSAAVAHPGHYHPDEVDEFDAFMPGLMHPLGGFDHLLLALAVGWLAFSQVKSRPRLVLPVFLTSLLAGAMVGSGFEGGILLELLLAGTLFAAGAAFLSGVQCTGAAVVVAAAAGAGLLHGLAHGSEASAGGGGFYLGGIILCTAAICCMGGLLARLSRLSALPVSRVAGLVLLGSGVVGVLNASL